MRAQLLSHSTPTADVQTSPSNSVDGVKDHRSLAEEVRKDFPALDQRIGEEKPITYLDTAATSQKPQAVLDAIGRYYSHSANVHRGTYAMAAKATEEYEDARKSIAKFIGALPEEVVFTSGATDAINLVAQSWGIANIELGDEIITTAMEHHSNMVPWQLLAKRCGAVVKYVRFGSTGELDLQHFKSLLTPLTKLVAVTHISNTLGCINPVSAIVDAAHRIGALVLLDACQSAPHLKLDVASLGVDFLVASGHKMYGPTGVGFLWARREVLEGMPPWKGGGEMIKEVSLDAEKTTFADIPARFEAGTPPIAQAIGMGAACEYLMSIGMERIEAYERHLANYLWQALSEIEDLQLYGPPPSRGRAALLSFNDASGEEVYPVDIAVAVGEDGFCIRAGRHCAHPVHQALGKRFGSARVSLGIYNTTDDIDRFARSLRENLEMLRDGEGCTFDPEDPDACFCSSDRARS